MHAIVHPAQQHALVTHRYAGIGHHFTSGPGCCRHLVGMVEMGIDPYGMVLSQHGHELRGNPLRAYDRGACPDANDLDVGNFPQADNYGLQAGIAHGQGVSAGQEHIPYLRGTGNIVDAFLDPVTRGFVILLAGKAASCTMTAIHGTLVGDQEKDPVGIPVCQSGDR